MGINGISKYSERSNGTPPGGVTEMLGSAQFGAGVRARLVRLVRGGLGDRKGSGNENGVLEQTCAWLRCACRGSPEGHSEGMQTACQSLRREPERSAICSWTCHGHPSCPSPKSLPLPSLPPSFLPQPPGPEGRGP
ncbi:hypothetical protein AAFF_G00282390 [Aldrovandia affinis]|uniref:Uncharacterized protein n=1 Tax=Aldrovandia affinis TaxID=143900 RepID=A0AAD7X1J2_9TELE|nr:hypothetical protein AAFF_G00282390 [Aldrovandia affinis]